MINQGNKSPGSPDQELNWQWWLFLLSTFWKSGTLSFKYIHMMVVKTAMKSHRSKVGKVGKQDWEALEKAVKGWHI